jgi:hypothetical protein
MTDTLRCPHCGFSFELSSIVRDQVVGEVRKELEDTHRRHLAEAVARAEREAAASTRLKDEELAATRAKLEAASKKEAEVLRAQRALEDRARTLEADAERTGPEFKNRLGGMVEAFGEMEEDLAKEKRALFSQLRKREKLLARARDNIVAFYGDLRGIAGRQLAELPAMTLARASLATGAGAAAMSGDDEEAEPASDRGGARGADDGADAALVELLEALLPADGQALGNVTLCAQLSERALSALARDVDEAEYMRARDALVASGRARKGKGRGGSLARVLAGEDAEA